MDKKTINMQETKQKILLVDDDTGLLGILSLRLSAMGYEIVTEESGEDALARLPLFRPDLVITDLKMGGMDGMALSDNIRKQRASMPVIILTAHGTIPEAVTAIKEGVFSFLTKPFDTKVLLAQIEKALTLSGQGKEDENHDPQQLWRKPIIYKSTVMEELLSQATLVAASDTSVFITGETGTGKEVLARGIHHASAREGQPFVDINCCVIPEALLESELFGHKRGAFTGAVQDKEGLFQSADGGTLFLDEIGDMPIALQSKLLRAIQEREIRPVGATQSISIDVRILSASHRNLLEEIEAGRFREDLYYRLVVVTLEVPALAGRPEDIPLLARHFLDRLLERSTKKMSGFSPDASKLLLAAPWPGNVRQLQNVVEQAFTLATTPIITAALVQKALREEPQEIPSFTGARDQFERDYLIQLLQMTDGNVSHAADIAKRNRTDFYKLLSRHNLAPAEFRSAPE